ncbi:MAG: hypothetical protein K1X53_12290 [Candidatus Sumerlaeaceae bacterium]|nr:hypothetical protein [Candidatus Sumerlaeaceae bacterium]
MEVLNRTGRRVYQHTGGVNLFRFLLIYAATLAVAGALGAGLFWLLTVGFYFVLVMPLLFAMGVGGLMLWTVYAGQCRSRLLGGAAGLIAGFVLYIGSYYTGMVYTYNEYFGIDVSKRLDMLPAYILRRINSDRYSSTHSPRRKDDEPRRRDGMDNFMGWFTFVAEFGLTLFITAGAGWVGAGRAFCPKCQKWMKQDLTAFPPGSGQGLVEALNNSRFAEALVGTAFPMLQNQPYTALQADYCEGQKYSAGTCPVYVSVKDVRSGGGATKSGNFDFAIGKSLAKRWELTVQEVAQLATRIPSLAPVAERQGVSVQAVATKMAVSAATAPGGATVPARPAVSMAITPATQPAGKLMSKGKILMGTLIELSPILFIVGGAILGITGGDRLEKAARDADNTVGIVLASGGGALVLWGFVAFFLDLGNRYRRGVLRTEVAARPDAVVSANDSEAMIVSIVPMANLPKMMVEEAIDVGLIKVDRGRREILFEGDKERYRIPAEAVQMAIVGEQVTQAGHATTTRYYLFLRANGPNGTWENAILPRRKSAVVFGKGKLRTHVAGLLDQMKQIGAVGADVK